MDLNLPQYSVCILAYNEEKNISATLQSIVNVIDESVTPVYVYANGCTDKTIEIAKEFICEHSNVHLREIPIASKPNAWNTAFAEQNTEFIVFSDGDICPDKGAAGQLVSELINSPSSVMATCLQVPARCGLDWQRKFVGFMQMPLKQDFLSGGFYAVRRQALAALLNEHGYAALPVGVTGEDCFLDAIVGPDRLLVLECLSAYEPPCISDYCRYLARIRWQNEQLALILPQGATCSTSGLRKFISKFEKSRNRSRFLLSIMAVCMRYFFKVVAAAKIRRYYLALGPVRMDGASILQSATRSFSSK